VIDPLSPGRIVWAVDPGDRGGRKLRPMIVATRRTELIRTGQFLAVVCSTDVNADGLHPSEVELPSHAEGRCSTRLRRRTVAVCDWTTTLAVEDVRDTGGVVPATLLREICIRAGLTFTTER